MRSVDQQSLLASLTPTMTWEKALAHRLSSSIAVGQHPLRASLLGNMSIVELLAAETALEKQRNMSELTALRNTMAVNHKLQSLRALTNPPAPTSMNLLSLLAERISARPKSAFLQDHTKRPQETPSLYSHSSKDPRASALRCKPAARERTGTEKHLPVTKPVPNQQPRRRPKKCSATAVSFPAKLFNMLKDAEAHGHDDVISFLPHGKAFMIHKPEKFAQDIMPKYFKTGRLSSFHRQLNLYGFKRNTFGQDVGAFYHEYFQRDDQKLVAKIQRKKQRVPDGEPADQWTERTAVLRALSVSSPYF